MNKSFKLDIIKEELVYHLRDTTEQQEESNFLLLLKQGISVFYVFTAACYCFCFVHNYP